MLGNKKKWITALCVACFIMVVVGVILGWNYYKNTHVFESYGGRGQVVAYEECEDGLIVVLKIDEDTTPRRNNKPIVKLLIDQETKMLFPGVVYVMKDRMTGFEVRFSTRDFWLPDEMYDKEFIYPASSILIEDGQWSDLLEMGTVDKTAYEEFEKKYTGEKDMELLGIT